MAKRFALIIGSSEYEDTTLAKLNSPGADVEGFANALNNPEIGGFNEVVRLINQPVSTVRREISRFLTHQKRLADLLLLYFSGHGVLDEQGRLYLAAQDTERDYLQATAVSAAFITEEMDRSRSQRIVLILDCCHSGAFARGAKNATGASVGTKNAFEGNGYGRVVLTATDVTQYAWEGDELLGDSDTSMFTRFLIRGLETGEADINENGTVSIDELYDYTYEQVIQRTTKQTPGKWSFKQQGEIIIARNPRINKSKELPPDLLRTLHDGHPWEREGAIIELGRIKNDNNPELARYAREILEKLLDDDSKRIAAAAAAQLDFVPTANESEQIRSEAESTADAAQQTAVKSLNEAAAPKQPDLQTKSEVESIDTPVTLAEIVDEFSFTAETPSEQGIIQQVILSPSNKTIAVASSTAVWLFDLESLKLIYHLTMPAGYPLSIAWSPDGKQIATGCSDSLIYIWDALYGKLQRTLEGHSSQIFALAWYPDSRQLATTGQDSTIRIWQAGQKTERLILEGHVGSVLSLDWSKDGRWIISSGTDNQVRIWDSDIGRCVHTINNAHDAPVNTVAWSPNSKKFASGSDDTIIRIWDVSGQMLKVLSNHTDAIQVVAWSPDGKRLASGSDDSTIRIWDASDFKTLRLLSPQMVKRGKNSKQLTLNWLDSSIHLVSGASDGIVRLWNIVSGLQLQTIKGFSSL